jgi:cysteine synthase
MITDLIELPEPSREAGFPILGKAEYQNPTGSIKDRPISRILSKALESGALRPGMWVVEATTGNTGIGLAHLAQQHGLRAVIFKNTGQAEEKARRMRAMGARVFEVASPPEGPDQKIQQALLFVERMKGMAWYCDQFNNPHNPEAHHDTAREIWSQRPDVAGFVAGAGTGGTLLGIQQWCRQHRPEVQIGYVIAHTTVDRPTLAEGTGRNIPSRIREQLRPDHEWWLSDSEFLRWMRPLAIGPSAAMNVEAAIRMARVIQRPVATVLCDGLERYPGLITE